MRCRGHALLGLISLLAGCGPAEQATVNGVVRDGRTGEPVGGATVRAEDGPRVTTGEDGRFEIQLPVGSGRALRAFAEPYCPTDHELEVRRRDTPEATLHMWPRLRLQTEYLQVGFGREVTLEARTPCDDNATLHWTQTSGPELGPDQLRTEDGGRQAILRMPALAEVVELDDRLGVVALSRAQRLDYRFRVETEVGGREETRDVRVTAASPQGGFFQVPEGQDVYLNGGAGETHRWELTSRPDESQAELHGADTRTPWLRPDEFGPYVVRHQPSGREIMLMGGAFEDVPRDCGRGPCHQSHDDGWQATAHARTFQRGIEGELGADFSRRCWACHATGVDEGVDNGGLHQTADRIHFEQPPPGPDAWQRTKRTIRRLGSVWCSSCHGPGRILPPEYHWEYGAKFQVGVCAQCHDVTDDPDANHDSPHVREWRLAPMSQLSGGLDDDSPARRRGCSDCHTSQGFLGWLRGEDFGAPRADTVAPITCPTCHDPHSGANPRALRVYGTLDDVGGLPVEGAGSGAICMSCHRTGYASPDDESAAPHAPQGDVLLGRGSRQMRRSTRPGPHATLENSCVTCHMARPPAGDPLADRAGGHTFSIRDLTADRSPRHLLNRHACADCHGAGVPPHSIGGIEDRDGDGRADDIGEEFARAVALARSMARERIDRAGVADECSDPNRAADYVERDARLLLVDGRGGLLGDCNSDGRITGRERAVGIEQLSMRVRAALYDISMLERDGSRGRHNPDFTFSLLRQARNALR